MLRATRLTDPSIIAVEEARRSYLDGRFLEAKRLAQAITKKNPGDRAAVEIEALAELEQGDLERARRLLRKLVKEKPNNLRLRLKLAVADTRSGRLQAAADGFREVTKYDPQQREAKSSLASVLANLGQFDEMVAVCREALDAGSREFWPYVNLAFNRPDNLTDADIEDMRRLAGDETLSEQLRAGLKFALAEVLGKRKRPDDSFQALKDANDTVATAYIRLSREERVRPGGSPYRSIDEAEETHRKRCDFVKSTFTKEFFEKFGGHGEQSRVPIFIVGMPRSGTTLLEQILATHPSTFGAGEISDLSIITHGSWPYTAQGSAAGNRLERPPERKERYFAKLGKAYLDRMRELDPKAQHVVNKTLSNYVHIGMIELCLPNAVIIDARREPADNCLACYQRQFRDGQEFSYDLGALGRRYRRYDAMMAHWNEVLPGRVLRMDYEKLVSDPEPNVRRLLEHCRMPWSPEVMKFYENSRPVRTASVSQVRKPISTASVAKWKPFEKHLGPLFDALGDLAPAEVRKGG